MPSPPPVPTPTSQDRSLDRVTVVMATFHSGHCAAELGRCLIDFPHVIVIDNASGDDTVAQVRQHLPHAKLIVNDCNRGFGAANNQGVWAAATEFVLLINPDCIIGASDALAMIQSADRYPEASAIGPQLLDRKRHLDVSYAWTPDSWPPKGPAAEAEVCVGFISGACMLIRRQAMVSIQGFDEGFFLYQEDTDLCLRLARQCGALIVAPKATVTHLSRSSSAGKARFKAEYIRGYHHIQSKFLFELKHHQRHVTKVRRWRYGTTAALEALVRIALLDLVRAARVVGRMVGVLRYPQDMRRRQAQAKQAS